MKDETAIIYLLGNDNFVVTSVGSHNEPILMEDDESAIKFPNTQIAQQFISDLNTTASFWGTRPPRKPK